MSGCEKEIACFLDFVGGSLELILVLIIIIIIGIVIAGATIAVSVKKPKPTQQLEEAFEEALQELELTGIKGIGSKRADELRAVGVNTISDLATSSTKDLSQKTGIPEKVISRWIEQAKEIIE